MTRDWRNFFTAEDFEEPPELDVHSSQTFYERAADVANAILRKELENAPEVFGEHHSETIGWIMSKNKDYDEGGVLMDTHKARLIDIRAIEEGEK